MPIARHDCMSAGNQLSYSNESQRDAVLTSILGWHIWATGRWVLERRTAGQWEQQAKNHFQAWKAFTGEEMIRQQSPSVPHAQRWLASEQQQHIHSLRLGRPWGVCGCFWFRADSQPRAALGRASSVTCWSLGCWDIETERGKENLIFIETVNTVILCSSWSRPCPHPQLALFIIGMDFYK